MSFRELEIQSNAIDYLARHLIEGTLVLFLGAGVSREFGFPLWIDFANEFRIRCGLTGDLSASTSTPEEIQAGLDQALDEIDNSEVRKIEIVRAILYGGIAHPDVADAFSNHLLISILSLLIGRNRGHVKRVVTFNYDSILEWFLRLFGFDTKSISNLPALEGAEDVRIYHPHGFVPHSSLDLVDSDFLIVGLLDANLRAGVRADLWREKEMQLLESGVGLFIGLSPNSLSDRAVAPTYSAVGRKLINERPLGIWLSYSELSSIKKEEFWRTNIVPLEISESLEISKFLMNISRRALEIRQGI